MTCTEISPTTGYGCTIDGEHHRHDDGNGEWILLMQPFEEWAEEAGIEEEDLNEWFAVYMNEMTGQIWT